MEQSANPAVRVGHYTRTISTSTQNASIWSLTAAAPSDSVFRALCTNLLTYLLTYLFLFFLFLLTAINIVNIVVIVSINMGIITQLYASDIGLIINVHYL